MVYAMDHNGTVAGAQEAAATLKSKLQPLGIPVTDVYVVKLTKEHAQVAVLGPIIYASDPRMENVTRVPSWATKAFLDTSDKVGPVPPSGQSASAVGFSEAAASRKLRDIEQLYESVVDRVKAGVAVGKSKGIELETRISFDVRSAVARGAFILPSIYTLTEVPQLLALSELVEHIGRVTGSAVGVYTQALEKHVKSIITRQEQEIRHNRRLRELGVADVQSKSTQAGRSYYVYTYTLTPLPGQEIDMETLRRENTLRLYGQAQHYQKNPDGTVIVEDEVDSSD
jgi:hypothetical protein